MKARAAQKSVKNIARMHEQLVDKIVADTRASELILRPWTQWFLWLGISLAVMGVFWMKMGIQTNAAQVLQQMPPIVFILTAFAGAALAAWEAIASTVPGRQTGSSYRVLSVLVLIALFSLPFIFFAQSGPVDLAQSFKDGSSCAEGVSLSGLIPWIFLGWMLSRNAAFHPAWTGAWSGVSSFLMGTITLQIHCPSWQLGHMLAAHLLPAAFGSFLTTFAGAFWFSRWKK